MNNIIYSTNPDISKIPGGWEPKDINFSFSDNTKLIYEEVISFRSEGWNPERKLLHNVFNKNDCNKLVYLMNQSPNVEGVSIQGRKDIIDDRIGSVRTTMWCPKLAEMFYNKMKLYLDKRVMNKYSSTDWWQGNKKRIKWEPVGISPMLRFMRYNNNGQHYAHYDAGFIYPDDNYRTLMSFVAYLTTNKNGGSTRFVEDKQSKIPVWDRNHEDWTREVNDEEILYVSDPVQGRVLVFDHRICHDVEKYTGNTPRIIIRGDILFKAIL